MRTIWDHAVHDDELRHLHSLGHSDPAISRLMGFDPTTISKHRVGLGLPNRGRPQTGLTRPEPNPPPPRMAPNPIVIANLWLRGRLTERPGHGYLLDGRPVNLDEVMRATNRLLERAQAEQIGPGRWRV